MKNRKNPTLLLALTLSVLGLVLGAAPASAGLLVESATDCEAQQLEQPFKRWLDPLRYVQVGDGGLEHGAQGWSLRSAAVVAGNEPWNVAGSSDSHSVRIEPGGSVTTPAMCAGLLHPTLRMFTKSSGSLLSLSTLRVDVLFNDAGGNLRSLPISLVPAGRSWSPTLPIPVIVSALGILEETPIAFRFTPQGRQTWWVDDVYVDPIRRS